MLRETIFSWEAESIIGLLGVPILSSIFAKPLYPIGVLIAVCMGVHAIYRAYREVTKGSKGRFIEVDRSTITPTSVTNRMPAGEAGEKYTICHGCGGRGWVEVGGRAQICPVCGGSGVVPSDPRRRQVEEEKGWRY